MAKKNAEIPTAAPVSAYLRHEARAFARTSVTNGALIVAFFANFPTTFIVQLYRFSRTRPHPPPWVSRLLAHDPRLVRHDDRLHTIPCV